MAGFPSERDLMFSALALFLLVAVDDVEPVSHVTTVAPIEASGGVALGPDGYLYVSDFGSSLMTAGGSSIYRISIDGAHIEVLSDEFGGASGNGFGADGYLYQSDVGRGEAYRVELDGQRTRLADGLHSPVGIVSSENGVTYIAECTANEIARINRDGAVERIATGMPLNCPNGLTFGPDGNLYAANFRDGAIVRISIETGDMSLFARVPGGGNGHIRWGNGRFYIASFQGNQIYSVSMEGEICHIAGSGEPDNRDGEGLSAALFRPNGVAISPDGDTLYTNTISEIVEPFDPRLHPNHVRRVDGLLSLLDCPPERIVAPQT